MKRALLLQIEATQHKQKRLCKFEKQATRQTNSLSSERTKYHSFNNFWKAIGKEVKQEKWFQHSGSLRHCSLRLEEAERM